MKPKKVISNSDKTSEKDYNIDLSRAIGRSENPGVPVLFGGHNLPLLVEVGLTDLPKSGGASTPGTPRDNTPCLVYISYFLDRALLRRVGAGGALEQVRGIWWWSVKRNK